MPFPAGGAAAVLSLPRLLEAAELDAAEEEGGVELAGALVAAAFAGALAALSFAAFLDARVLFAVPADVEAAAFVAAAFAGALAALSFAAFLDARVLFAVPADVEAAAFVEVLAEDLLALPFFDFSFLLAVVLLLASVLCACANVAGPAASTRTNAASVSHTKFLVLSFTIYPPLHYLPTWSQLLFLLSEESAQTSDH